jgi:hypothetical protein
MHGSSGGIVPDSYVDVHKIELISKIICCCWHSKYISRCSNYYTNIYLFKEFIISAQIHST